MKTAKLLKIGKDQVVRLPEEFRFEGTEVFIKRVGNTVVLLPAGCSWDSLMTSLDQVPPGFMESRDQPTRSDNRKGL